MTTAWARRHLPALGLLLLTAASARLAWVAFVRPDPADGRFDDTVWYRGAAHYVANGDGYVNPFTGTPTAGWPPGYPAFLGAVFKLAGEGVWQTALANIVLSLISVVLVYCIGNVLLERRTALIAAAAMAVWPGQVYFSSLTLSEPLFTALFLACVLLLVLVPRAGGGRAGLVVLFGVVVGLATLTRGQALILLPLAAACWVLAGMRWGAALRWTALTVLVVGVVLTPWVVRNEQKLGSPVVIATNLGPNLWIGNHEGASGRMPVAEPHPPWPERGDKTQPEFEVAADRLALKKGLTFMFTHPGDELRLSLTKIRAMYESDATALDWNSGFTDGFYATEGTEDTLRAFANGFWFAALGLSAVGLIASRARLTDRLALLPLLTLGWTATHLLFFGDPRFHYPIVFVFALLGARGALVLAEALRRPQPSLGGRYAAA